MKLDMATPSEAYDDGFAEGVDWATPRIWNEAIEAAAELMDKELGDSHALSPFMRARAAAIRKLRKE